MSIDSTNPLGRSPSAPPHVFQKSSQSTKEQQNKVEEAKIRPTDTVASKDARYKMKSKSVQQMNSTTSSPKTLKKIKVVQDFNLMKLRSSSTASLSSSSSSHEALSSDLTIHMHDDIKTNHPKDFEDLKSMRSYLNTIYSRFLSKKLQIDQVINEILKSEFYQKNGERQVDNRVREISEHADLSDSPISSSSTSSTTRSSRDTLSDETDKTNKLIAELKKLISDWENIKDNFEEDGLILDIHEKLKNIETVVSTINYSINFVSEKEKHNEIINKLKEIDKTSSLINNLINNIKKQEKQEKLISKLLIIENKIKSIEIEEQKLIDSENELKNSKNKYSQAKMRYDEVNKTKTELLDLSYSIKKENENIDELETNLEEITNKSIKILDKYNKKEEDDNHYTDFDSLHRDLGKKLIQIKSKLRAQEKDVRDLHNTLLLDKSEQYIQEELNSGPAKSKTIQQLYKLESTRLNQMKSLFDEINTYRYGKTFETDFSIAKSLETLEIVAEHKIPLKSIENIIAALT